MATSESDDFESADEELNARTEQRNRSKKYTSIGSDSDDDVDYIPVQYHTPMKGFNKREFKTLSNYNSIDNIDNKPDKVQMELNKTSDNSKKVEKNTQDDKNKKELKIKDKIESENNETNKELKLNIPSKETVLNTENSQSISNKRQRPQKQRKPKEVQSLNAKKLGAVKIDKLLDESGTTPDEVREEAKQEGKPPLITECWEECDEKNLEEELRNAEKQNKLKQENLNIEDSDVPAELKSNLKFKDIFKPDGWEGLGEDVELPDDLADDKYHPVLDKLTLNNTEKESTNNSWGGWGNWGVSSLLNTATASVSTLTSHVSQGLSLLEESIGVPDPVDSAKVETPSEEKSKSEDKVSEDSKESQSQFLPSFGFSNFISSVSSITKLVESTSTKVISGGLDTLESIGKKTMEVLQEGDPGLKRKRAFFSNDTNKPILSQVLREAKEKADAEEKSMEEKQSARTIHFESLFDDYQGLVHLEALEILSKQCDIKIQNQLINLEGDNLTSMQETLEEVKELCDLGGEGCDDDEEEEIDFEQRLKEACKDLGVSITYDKLINIWNDMNSQLSSPQSNKICAREILQKAISALAQFTAYSVERFHKTAELLLVKERRSTVNEADSLVQVTKILSSQIASIASLYINYPYDPESNEKSEINSNMTTISFTATNASAYIQEAFGLLIPIVQVGTI